MDVALEHLLPAVEEQLNSPETPYVRETLERLLDEPDIEDGEARAMIAFCLADEIEALELEKRNFSEERYQMLLGLLPIMPEGR